MIPAWLRPHRRRHHRQVDSPRSPRHFSCSSFKDIQDLLAEDSPPEPDQPRRPSLFHRIRSPSLREYSSRAAVSSLKSFSIVDIPNADRRGVVVYFTSLRVVRKTFEECRTVRSILRGFRISIDERDLSMDSKFLDELLAIFGTKKVTLPRIFIGGRYIGGAEEIKQMQESDELRKLIGALPPFDDAVGICDVCGGMIFVLCERCNGSHKIFSEKSGFKTCTACNVHGLIRCSSCFPSHRRRISS